MTIIAKMFAVRHKPTNKYLGLVGGIQTRGATQIDPVDPKDPTQQIRLFVNLQSARCALTAYCLGEFHSTPPRWGDGDVDGGIEVEHVAWRKKYDFEVIPVTINTRPQKT